MKAQGWGFILGETLGSTHHTFNVGYKDMPPYPELKQWVLKANNGQLDVAASSAPAHR